MKVKVECTTAEFGDLVRWCMGNVLYSDCDGCLFKSMHQNEECPGFDKLAEFSFESGV